MEDGKLNVCLRALVAAKETQWRMLATDETVTVRSAALPFSFSREGSQPTWVRPCVPLTPARPLAAAFPAACSRS